MPVKQVKINKRYKKRDASTSGPKRNHVERTVDRQEMVKLMCKGWTQRMIAEKFGVSQPQISFDFKVVMEQNRKHLVEDVKELASWKLEEYAEIKKEAWAEWERSKADLQRITEESHGNGDGEGWRESKVTEGRLAANGYLNTVLECLKAERDLLGLNPAKELHVQGSMTNTVDWKVLAAGIPADGVVPDDVEREIQKAIEAGPVFVPKEES